VKNPATLDLLDPSPPEGPGIVVGLFQRQATKVRRYLSYRLHSDEDGKDAAQETFLKLLRREREGGLREDPNGSYLFSAAYSVAIDAERERTVRDRHLLAGVDETSFASEEASPEDKLHWRNAMAHFVSCVESLDDGPRQVFVMRYFKAMTYPEIASKMGMTTRTIERYAAKALRRLTADMKEYL
jgi:RNA polymerase sigma factor (sigma-70 family)